MFFSSDSCPVCIFCSFGFCYVRELELIENFVTISNIWCLKCVISSGIIYLFIYSFTRTSCCYLKMSFRFEQY